MSETGGMKRSHPDEEEHSQNDEKRIKLSHKVFSPLFTFLFILITYASSKCVYFSSSFFLMLHQSYLINMYIISGSITSCSVGESHSFHHKERFGETIYA
jgi:hypothetical protein